MGPLTETTAEKGTKTKAKGDRNRDEGKRDTKTNAEEGLLKAEMKAKYIPRLSYNAEEDGKNKNDDKKGTKTNQWRRTQGTSLCVGAYGQGPCRTRWYTSAGPIIES